MVKYEIQQKMERRSTWPRYIPQCPLAKDAWSGFKCWHVLVYRC